MKEITLEVIMRKHTLEQSRERGISINEIKETIQNGAKFIQDEKEGKVVSDYRHIRVIFKKKQDKFFVISVMIRK